MFPRDCLISLAVLRNQWKTCLAVTSAGYPPTQQRPTIILILQGCTAHYGGIIDLTMDFQAREAGRCRLVAEALRSWGRLKLRATGQSMLPALWPGDLLTVQSCPPELIEPGEIVLYMRGERFFIHRVVSKGREAEGAFLITRGDCMAENDPPVRSDELLGRIAEVQRAGSIFVPAPTLSPVRRIAARMLCHWSLFRRATLRLREQRHRDDRRNNRTLVEAAS